MREFKYPFYAKLIYRYANIPITLLLLFLIYVASYSALGHIYGVAFIAIHVLLIIWVNKVYWKNYKFFPYKIEISNTKMICTNYFMSDKKVELNINQITKVTGGIFTNTPTKPIYLEVNNGELKIGISQHIKGYKELLTVLLTNLKKEVYDEVLDTIKSNAIKKESKKK